MLVKINLKKGKNLNIFKKYLDKKRKNINYYHCEKKDNKIRDCRFKKVGINFHSGEGKSKNPKKFEKSENSKKVNAVEGSSQGLLAMISVVPTKELNMTATTSKNQY